MDPLIYLYNEKLIAFFCFTKPDSCTIYAYLIWRGLVKSFETKSLDLKKKFQFSILEGDRVTNAEICDKEQSLAA